MMDIIKAADMERFDKFRILLFAQAGTGKTSALKHLRGKTLVIDFDGSTRVLSGAQSIDIIVADKNNINQFIMELMQNIDTLIKPYDNLAFDNISAFQFDWFVEASKESKSGLQVEVHHYQRWNNYFLRFLRKIYSLPVNVILTAWEDTDSVTLESGQVISRYVPQIRPTLLNPVVGLTQIVARMTINPETGGRGAILDGNASMLCKNQLTTAKAVSIEKLFLLEEH